MPSTMSRTEMFKKVCELAAEQVGADPAEITEQTNFVADLNYDSLNQLEFTLELEDAFEVDIPDTQAEAVKTVGAAFEMLCQQIDPEHLQGD